MVVVVVIVVDARFNLVCTTIGQSGVPKWCNDASVAEMLHTLNHTSSGGGYELKLDVSKSPVKKFVNFCVKVLNKIFLTSFCSKICFDFSSIRQFKMTENFG